MGEPAADEVLLVDRERPGTATITLNRPHRKNAWNVPLQRAYFEALATLDADPDVRAIVVRGAGGNFCPGADTDALQGYSDTGTTNPDMATIPHPEWFPATIDTPIIAAVEGACAGVGLAQTLMCDVRIATPGARLTTAFAKRALPPMHGMVPLLTRAAGDAVATELLLTARVFTGEEAQRLGVVTEISEDPHTRALELAAQLATWCAPSALATARRHLNEAWIPRIAEAVERVDATLDDVLSSADFREGLASFLERRPPNFPPATPPASPDPKKR